MQAKRQSKRNKINVFKVPLAEGYLKRKKGGGGAEHLLVHVPGSILGGASRLPAPAAGVEILHGRGSPLCCCRARTRRSSALCAAAAIGHEHLLVRGGWGAGTLRKRGASCNTPYAKLKPASRIGFRANPLRQRRARLSLTTLSALLLHQPSFSLLQHDTQWESPGSRATCVGFRQWGRKRCCGGSNAQHQLPQVRGD